MIRIGILGAARIAPRGIVTPANELLGTEVVAVASRELSRARDFAAEHSIPMAFGSVRGTDRARRHRPRVRAAAAIRAPAVVHGRAGQRQTRAGGKALRQQCAKMRRRWWPRRAPRDGTSSKASTTAFIRCSSGRSRRCAAAPSAASGTSRRCSTPHLPDTPGELRYIEELGGGALMDLGCYCMHWIRTVAGDEPSVVSASARCVTPGVDIDGRSRAGLHQRADRLAQVFDAARRWRVVPAAARAGRQGFAGFREPGVAALRRHAVHRVRPLRPRRRSSPAARPRFTTSCGTCST